MNGGVEWPGSGWVCVVFDLSVFSSSHTDTITKVFGYRHLTLLVFSLLSFPFFCLLSSALSLSAHRLCSKLTRRWLSLILKTNFRVLIQQIKRQGRRQAERRNLSLAFVDHNRSGHREEEKLIGFDWSDLSTWWFFWRISSFRDRKIALRDNLKSCLLEEVVVPFFLTMLDNVRRTWNSQISKFDIRIDFVNRIANSSCPKCANKVRRRCTRRATTRRPQRNPMEIRPNRKGRPLKWTASGRNITESCCEWSRKRLALI